MKLVPSFEDFESGWTNGANQLVFARLAADLDTPVSLMLKLGEARTDTFMLESVTGGEVRGRYSVVGMKPDLIWQCHGTTARINRQARFDPATFVDDIAAPLDSLRALIAESRIALPEGLPPIAAGLFGYLGYDMIRLVEHLPDVNPDPLGLPDAVLLRPSVIAVLDGVKGEVTVVAPAWVAQGLSARAAYAQAAERVMDALRDLDRAPAALRDLGEAAPVGVAHRISPMPVTRRRSKRRATTSAPVTSFKSSPRNAGRSGSNCRPSRFTAVCAAPTRRRSCSSSTSAAFK